MRLFLSSYRAGRHDKDLKKLIGDTKNVGIITNAKDYKSAQERKESVAEVFDFFKSLSVKPSEIDLRLFFNCAGVGSELKKYKFIWLAGGNTFILRKALSYSGADRYLIEKVKDNSIIYGGESAGAIIAAPNFTGIEFGDDPDIVPVGYEEKVIKEGLNLIPFHIVPHYKSAWEGASDMIKVLEAEKVTYKLLTDDQAILIDGAKEEFLE